MSTNKQNPYKYGCECPVFPLPRLPSLGSAVAGRMKCASVLVNSQASNRSRYVRVITNINERGRWEGAPYQFQYPSNS